MNDEERIEILTGEFAEVIGLSESFIEKFDLHLKKLSVFEQNEQIERLKKLLREQYVNILTKESVEIVENYSLSNLEKSALMTLSKDKAKLFLDWLTYLKEQGAKKIGKQRLDVLLAVFENVTVSELKEEMNYRMNMGHSGLIFRNENKAETSLGGSHSHLSKLSEQSKRIGQELADKHKKPDK